MCSLNFNHYCLLWQYDNINVGDDIKCKSILLFFNCSKGILTLGTAVLKPKHDRYHRIITELAEDNGGICSFTHKPQYKFINKMRTRPIENLNVLN